MAINSFQEKQIRSAILNKVDPDKINKNGPHWKGYIYVNGKLITKVKIPNSHKRLFHSNKAKYLVRDLKIEDEEYNQLVNCTLSGSDYYQILHNQ